MQQPILVFIGSVLMLAIASGCNRDAGSAPQPGSSPAATTPSVTPAETSTAPAGVSEVNYDCADGRRIQAQYDNSDPERPSASLVIDGQRFEMYNVVAASGARYGTERGLKPDHGLQWWTKGDEATLSEMVMDHTAGGPTELTTCRAIR